MMNKKAQMVRSFVAIDLPDSFKEILHRTSEQLRRQVSGDSVRWARIEGIHLTLQFLGNVAQSDLPQIEAALIQVGQRHAPFTFTVGGVGCFPNLRKPRVIWIGVQEETGALAALQRDVEKSLVPLGFKPEKRAFHPHLTLGRTRRHVRSADQRRLGEIIASIDVGELGHIHVKSFRLMRSDLRPSGAVYTLLALFELSLDQEGS
jgi:2'-5' RNA ligase